MAKYSAGLALTVATLGAVCVGAILGSGPALAQPVVGVVSCDGTNVVLSVPDLGFSGPVIVEISGTIEGRYSVTAGGASSVGPMPLPLPVSFPAPVQVLSNDMATDLADGSVSQADCPAAGGGGTGGGGTGGGGNPPPPPLTLPSTRDQCLKDGWRTYGVFKNQGDCVSFLSTHTRNLPALLPATG